MSGGGASMGARERAPPRAATGLATVALLQWTESCAIESCIASYTHQAASGVQEAVAVERAGRVLPVDKMPFLSIATHDE